MDKCHCFGFSCVWKHVWIHVPYNRRYCNLKTCLQLRSRWRSVYKVSSRMKGITILPLTELANALIQCNAANVVCSLSWLLLVIAWLICTLGLYINVTHRFMIVGQILFETQYIVFFSRKSHRWLLTEWRLDFKYGNMWHHQWNRRWVRKRQKRAILLVGITFTVFGRRPYSDRLTFYFSIQLIRTLLKGQSVSAWWCWDLNTLLSAQLSYPLTSQ